jgi:benzoate/toluate 1,2-dioxygenase subunit beta
MMGAADMSRAVESFILREARLLDRGEFETWLELYAPHGIYWMPSRPDQTDPLSVPSIIYEDHAILAMRVQRLLEARALVLTPMPRTTHMVSNIEIESADGEDVSAEAAFICVEYQGERQRMFSGRHAYRLARENGSFRIKMKRVALLNCDGVHSPITIPL